MKVGILTNEVYKNARKDTVGSSRIRGTWLVRHWDEAEIFEVGKKYDAVIYQKAYFLDHMRAFDGVKIFDLCDPDWLEGQPVVEAIELCDAVTVSSVGLYNYLKQITKKPVYFIPDRVDLSLHPQKKQHTQKANSVVWFGYHTNQSLLDQTLLSLKTLGLSLTVISDLPYVPSGGTNAIVDKQWIAENITNIKYDQETINDEIVRGGDIVMNPKSEEGKFKYKSENKTYIAWALNMPVAKDSDDLKRLIEPEVRAKEAEACLANLREYFSVEKSVQEYKDVISAVSK